MGKGNDSGEARQLTQITALIDLSWFSHTGQLQTVSSLGNNVRICSWLGAQRKTSPKTWVC